MQNTTLRNLALRHTDELFEYGKDLYPKYLSTPVRVLTDFLDGIIQSEKSENFQSSVKDNQRSFEDVEPFRQMTSKDLRYSNKISYEDFVRSLGVSLALMEQEKDNQSNYPGNQGFGKVENILNDIVEELKIDPKESKERVLQNTELVKAYKQANKFLERFKDGLMKGVPFFEMKNIFFELSPQDLQQFFTETAEPVVEMSRAADKISKFLTKDLGRDLIEKFNNLFLQIDNKYSNSPKKEEFLTMMSEITTGIDEISNTLNQHSVS